MPPMILRVGAALSCALAFGCSPAPAFCGHSFCLADEPKAVSKNAQEDFIVYRIEYAGQHYVIYEGNYPNTREGKNLGAMSPHDVPKGFVEGIWYEKKRGPQIVFRTINRRWPTYVAVSAGTDDPKALDMLLPSLTGKASNEG